MTRVAVAGAGAWGRNHIRALAGMRGVRLAWVIEPDERRREEAGVLAPRARLAADIGEALADPRLDALVVASPTPTHAPLSRAALAAGKHVLVEKPLASSADEAWDLVRRARRAKRLLAVGHLLLYHPAVQRLKRMVAAGDLGRIFYIYGQRSNLGRLRTDEGALASLAPHDISVMVHLLGTWPTSVTAHGATHVQPRWEDVVFLTFTFPGKVLGHVHLSWLDPQKVRRVSVVGSRRMAVFDDMRGDDRLRSFDSGIVGDATDRPAPTARAGYREHARTLATSTKEPLRQELAAFLRSVRGKAPCLTPGEDGARVVRVLDAAQRSLASGGTRISMRIR